jgi:3-(3-hydroxy-phenyl)propionate hydroxylase
MTDGDRVLIAGAGPVGLVAANCLADAGVPVTVFEAEPKLPENLRASTFQPPTLDMLAPFGASQRLIEMGRIARRMQYRDRGGWVAEFDFGVLADVTGHPFRVQCEQFKLNGVLAERLARMPHARVEFSSPVVRRGTGRGRDIDTVEGPAGRRRRAVDGSSAPTAAGAGCARRSALPWRATPGRNASSSRARASSSRTSSRASPT